MAALARLSSLLRNLFRRQRVERELDEELRAYLDLLAEEKRAAGMDADSARRAARIELGGLEQVREEVRHSRSGAALESLGQDFGYALRVLRKNPGFTVVVVLTLTLGIGANTAVFRLLNALRLRALPVRDPQGLAEIRIADRKGSTGSFNGRFPNLTYPQWEVLLQKQQVFSGLLAWSTETFDLSERGESRFAEGGLWVSGGFFDVLGVRPERGRVFSAADDQRGCPSPGVVLSHSFWKRELGGDESAVGRKIALNGHLLEVIGVTPKHFFGVEVGRRFDLAVPLCAEPLVRGEASRLDSRRSWWLALVGRLGPGVTLAAATAQLESLSPGLFEQTVDADYSPEEAKQYRAFRLAAFAAETGLSRVRREYDTSLWLLLGLAGVVLLVACANLANLMLARAGERQRELAVRLALGASRGRLVRQLLAESLLVAVMGMTLGGWLATALSGSIVSIISTEVNPLFVDVRTDGRVLSFMAALTALTCVLFGLLPALRATRAAPVDAMKAGGRATTAGRGRFGLRRALVVSQVALSLVLVVNAVLFARSLYNLLTLDVGFQQDGIVELDVDLTRLGLPLERRHTLRQELLARLRRVPGVEAATTASHVPLVGGRWNDTVYGEAGRKVLSNFNRVSPGYPRTLGVPLLAGRDFDERDTVASPPVAIVNESFARSLLGATDPIGRTLRIQARRGEPGPVHEIVGLVKDMAYDSHRSGFKPIVFLSALQDERPGLFETFFLRSSVPPVALMSAIRRTVVEADPGLRFHFHDFKAQIRDTLVRDRLLATLCGFLGFLALLLASIGLYGVISYLVTRRTHEIGIRIALGASRGRIFGLILSETCFLLVLGLAIGTGLAVLAAPGAASLLFGLAATEPLAYLLAVGSLAAVAATASSLPARRAARVEAAIALRCE